MCMYVCWGIWMCVCIICSSSAESCIDLVQLAHTHKHTAHSSQRWFFYVVLFLSFLLIAAFFMQALLICFCLWSTFFYWHFRGLCSRI